MVKVIVERNDQNEIMSLNYPDTQIVVHMATIWSVQQSLLFHSEQSIRLFHYVMSNLKSSKVQKVAI